jgi:hypothetical protein
VATTIITHVGISAFGSTALTGVSMQNLDEIVAALEQEQAREADLDLCVRDLIRGLTRIWGPASRKTLKQRRESSPAEIAALSRLLESRADDEATRVVLLASDTQSGRFCTNMLLQALTAADEAFSRERGYPLFAARDAVTTEAIGGLRITDDRTSEQLGTGELFVHTGLPSYVRAVYRAYQGLQSDDRLIFNITSGYKGLVPVAHDVALLLAGGVGPGAAKGIEVKLTYLYQNSSELISYDLLPTHPVWEQVPWEQLREAESRSGVSSDKVNVLRQLFTEAEPPRSPGQLRRSALGEVVWALGGCAGLVQGYQC